MSKDIATTKPEEKRLSEAVGAMKMAHAIGRFVDATRFALYKQMKDSGFYKLSGKDWKTFCKEELGRDQKTVNEEIEMLEQYGENFLLASQKIGISKTQLLLLGSTLSDEDKAEIVKGKIRIGQQEFDVNTIPDQAEEFMLAFGHLSRELDLTRKELKHATKKLDGIESETKKSEKSLLKKITDMEAIMNPETPEKLEEAFLALDKMLEDFDNALRALIWKQPWVKEDPAAQAKVEGLQVRAEKRFEHFRGDWDAFMNGDGE